MPLFHEMTDQDLVTSARRCTQPTYHALADRIEQRSADTLALANALTALACRAARNGHAVADPDEARAWALLERLEESGTMDKLKRIKGL